MRETDEQGREQSERNEKCPGMASDTLEQLYLPAGNDTSLESVLLQRWGSTALCMPLNVFQREGSHVPRKDALSHRRSIQEPKKS